MGAQVLGKTKRKCVSVLFFLFFYQNVVYDFVIYILNYFLLFNLVYILAKICLGLEYFFILFLVN